MVLTHGQTAPAPASRPFGGRNRANPAAKRQHADSDAKSFPTAGFVISSGTVKSQDYRVRSRPPDIVAVPIIPLHGHAALRRRLAERALTGALPASLLLHGQAGVGKQRLALWLGQLLLCEQPSVAGPCGRCRPCGYAAECAHPDIHWYFPRPRLKDSDASAADVKDDFREGRQERVEAGGLYAPPSGLEGLFVATVRTIVQQAGISPALGRRKVFVIGDAERMAVNEDKAEAANAFLKLLEEPPADTILILTSSEPGALLPTIRSRVVAVRVPPLGEDDMRAFLADPSVVGRIGETTGAGMDKRLREAGGAPGALLAGADRQAAERGARTLLDAATGERANRYRTAMSMGASRARGAFSDTLDALTVALHGSARDAVRRGRPAAALAAARGMDAVDDAREMASGNVNPQLLTARLLRELAEGAR
jgi:DNA polymerase III subunit delta'